MFSVSPVARLAIEKAVFEYPWQEDDFIRVLRQTNCIGMVADVKDQVAGFMIYELHKTRLHVLNFAVDPRFHRQGIGKAMVVKLIGKLSRDRRTRLLLEVRETNLDAQLFFRAMGFRAVSTIRNWYLDSDEDAYLMQYRFRIPQEATP